MTFDPLGQQRPLGRRSALRAERRRRRQLQTKVGLGALGVVLLVVTVLLVVGTGASGKKPGAAQRTQQTLLLQVKGADGTAVASALIAHDAPSKNGAVVLIPPQVIATVPGFGAQPFGRSLQTSARGSRNALSDLMGVTIDGSWVLDTVTFQRLVDQLGGIQVNVDVAVLAGRTVVLQPGNQHVDGSHALAFATYLAQGEEEQTRLTRLQAVIDGVINALPSSAQALVGSLGPGSQPSLSAQTVAQILLGLKSDGGAQQLQYRSLPVIKVDAGSDVVRFRVDADGTTSLVNELLAQSIPPGARSQGNRVLVLNGVGTPGLGEKVREKLVPAGFVFVGSRNAPSFDYATTLVLVRDATTQDQALGARVAQAIGVPVSSVQASDQVGTIADVVVIVGRDFPGAS